MSVEAQITNADAVGGIQIMVTPLKQWPAFGCHMALDAFLLSLPSIVWLWTSKLPPSTRLSITISQGRYHRL
jgi:hypothetical protein